MKEKLFTQDRWGLNVNSKHTTILKTVLFRCSLIPGSHQSVDLHEKLAHSALTKDSCAVFATETMDAIIHYKWGLLYPYILLQFLLRAAYLYTLFTAENYFQALEYWTVFHVLMMLLQVSFSTKSFLIWIYFLWPIMNVVEVVTATAVIVEHR